MKFSNAVKIITVIIIIGTLFVGISSFANDNIQNVDLADKLSTLGMLNGTEKGYELGRELPRVEGSIMLVRLLGKEAIAKNSNYSHPFTDVPAWADAYVGYLYEEGLSNGTSTTTFGSRDLMTTEQYTTFLLRALGYDDKNGDFKWNQSLSKASEIGMIDETMESGFKSKETFLRDDMVSLSYYALSSKLKNSKISLVQKLVDENAVSKTAAKQINLLSEENDTVEENVQNKKDNVEEPTEFTEIEDIVVCRVFDDSEYKNYVVDYIYQYVWFNKKKYPEVEYILITDVTNDFELIEEGWVDELPWETYSVQSGLRDEYQYNLLDKDKKIVGYFIDKGVTNNSEKFHNISIDVKTNGREGKFPEEYSPRKEIGFTVKSDNSVIASRNDFIHISTNELSPESNDGTDEFRLIYKVIFGDPKDLEIEVNLLNDSYIDEIKSIEFIPIETYNN